jgi:hypothetical protein
MSRSSLSFILPFGRRLSRLPGKERADFRACITQRWLQLQRPLPTAATAAAAANRFVFQSWFQARQCDNFPFQTTCVSEKCFVKMPRTCVSKPTV